LDHVDAIAACSLLFCTHAIARALIVLLGGLHVEYLERTKLLDKRFPNWRNGSSTKRNVAALATIPRT
jgi:hypothetical protein